MALERGARPLAQCLRCTRHERPTLPIRTFSTSMQTQQDAEILPKTKPPLDPLKVHTARLERKLMREQGIPPIGSRRRRAAMLHSPNIPFAELPYQCFQEARKFLQEDRNEKLDKIRDQRERIARLKTKALTSMKGNVVDPQILHRLKSMRTTLEHLKILADSNDPIVKKRFEDGRADMTKPIYRHYADKEWRSYKRKLLMQRIETMHVVPDVLPTIDPIVSTKLSFPSPKSGKRARNVQHGDIVDSRISEYPPKLKVQRYDKGEKLYTIAVINADVPNVMKDSFDHRCHFLACNIPLSPTQTSVDFSSLSADSQVVFPWLPAYAQEGLPYQRMSIFVLEQPVIKSFDPVTGTVPPSQRLDVAKVSQLHKGRLAKHENFGLRSFVRQQGLKPVGVDLFRTQWDEGTVGVMKRAGINGWDVVFLRKRIEPLPYKRLKENRYR